MTGYSQVAAATYLVVTLMWATLAVDFWHVLRRRRPRHPMYRVLPVLTAVGAADYACFVIYALTPTELDGRLPGLHAALDALVDVGLVAIIALVRHLVPLMAVRDELPAPGRRWLIVNYGSALVVAALVVLRFLAPGWTALGFPFWVLEMGYVVTMGALATRDVLRLVGGRGAWLPTALGEARRFDLVMCLCALLGIGGLLAVQLIARDSVQGLAIHPTRPALSATALVLHALVGITFGAQFAVRTLGRFALQFPLALVAFGWLVGGVVGAQQASARIQGPELRWLADLGLVLVLFAGLVAGRGWYGGVLEGIVLRRSRRRWAELRDFLHTQSPEVGAAECCRRVLAEVCRVLGARGVAILLDDGTLVVAGTLDTAPLVRVWPRGEAADTVLARAVLGAGEGRDLPRPLREAMAEAEVGSVVPIRSPRRRWGQLFLSVGLMGAPFTDEDIQATEAFAAELALVLDSTELLARAVRVERSLAHSEKLAALGEVSARIAHEIRNPVTAARSLAQQLARSGGNADDAEAAALILTELERVERQVASLLRFSRRDDFRFEPVDLGVLVAGTADGFRARLADAGIEVALETAPLTVPADREKMRQVLINLIENAIDALRDAPAPRRLTFCLGQTNGTATLSVSDTGVGVSADVLPHLFEPFFSGKAHGTGLGLAIVRRTVEAHGGRIDACSTPGAGLTLEIALPLEARHG